MTCVDSPTSRSPAEKGLPPLFSVRGKTVAVTGGSRGLGHAIAQAFLDAGARILLISRDPGAGRAAAEQLRGRGGRCQTISGDLATPDGRAQISAGLTAVTEDLDVLVHSAGRSWIGPLAEAPNCVWSELWAVNVVAVADLTARLAPLLTAAAHRAGQPARVIALGSIDATLLPPAEDPFPNDTYAVSKAALHQLCRRLARSLAPAITVNVLAPGLYPTDMTSRLLADPRRRAEIEAAIPLRRLGTGDDIAAAALYLASRAGAYLTGIVLPVDGGESCR